MSDEILNESAPGETDELLAATGALTDDPVAEIEELVEAGEVRFDKLKKAEEILRASSPSSFRDVSENSFEKVVHINRCSKVVKGGRRFSFSALVVSGDREGRVGFGFGKAQEVSECIKKSSEASKKQMLSVNITHNTIPHPVIGEHGGARVLLFPASPGTGLIAGGGVRAVVEAAGIKDLLASRWAPTTRPTWSRRPSTPSSSSAPRSRSTRPAASASPTRRPFNPPFLRRSHAS